MILMPADIANARSDDHIGQCSNAKEPSAVANKLVKRQQPQRYEQPDCLCRRGTP